MKKVIISFAIVLSSFFIFNFKVESLTFTYEDYSFVNNDEFKDVIVQSNNLLKDIGYENFFVYKTSTFYAVVFYNGNLFYTNTDSFSNYKPSIMVYGVVVYKYSSGSLTKFNTFSKQALSLYVYYSTNPISNNITEGESLIINLPNNRVVDYQNKQGNVSSLYEECVKDNVCGSLSDSHLEEKKVLESFYSLCIEKIKYLGEVFISNYIYLTAFCVCILMFVFSLIVRRFL